MVVLNIGLNINEKLSLDKVEVIQAVSKYANIINYRFDSGQYKDVSEPTIVFKIDKIRDKHVQYLCDELQQDCIGVFDGSKGKLLYGLNYVGDKMKFDSKYFIDF